MLYVVVALFAFSVSLITYLVVQAVVGPSRLVHRRLAELELLAASPFGPVPRRARQARRERWETLIRDLGEKLESHRGDSRAVRRLLVQAGFRRPDAVAVYLGVRVALACALAVAALLLLPATGTALNLVLLGAAWGAGLGWVAPGVYVGRRLRARQKELQKALPDALDMMVVCVEAGLGLNQAIVRVAEEIRHVSTVASEEFGLVNLEIRAGTPREEALRNLGERTGVEDLRTLVAMLIQTDRFGTSIAQALRVHSDTMRTKRRQRAEEAAAKTAIKMLFPLVFFIFPAMFVVILGPAMIQILEALGGMK